MDAIAKVGERRSLRTIVCIRRGPRYKGAAVDREPTVEWTSKLQTERQQLGARS